MPPTPGKERILVAEDDAVTRAAIVALLTKEDYRVLEAEEGKRAFELALAEQPALAIFDIEMPGMGGMEAVELLRLRGLRLPILMLSARATEDDRVGGLECGADDYLVKPFSAKELLARVRALLRRSRRADVPADSRVPVGAAIVDLATSMAQVQGRPLRLTRTESAILRVLARTRGRPVTRAQMLDQVWGYTYLPETRTLDTHVWRLRRKLGDTDESARWIVNVPGVGYQLQSDPSAAPAPAEAETSGDSTAVGL